MALVVKERWPFGLARSRRAQLDLSKPKKEGQAMLKLFFSKAKFAGEKKPAEAGWDSWGAYAARSETS